MENDSPTQKRAGKYFGIYLTIILFLVTFGFGVLIGQVFVVKKDVTNAQDLSVGNIVVSTLTGHTGIDLSQFWQVWDFIKTDYVKKGTVQDKDLIANAIQGMVAGLGDPYSVYFQPKQAEEFNNDLSGQLEGIGAEIGMRNNQLVVISPLSDSPAQKAGLLAGDKILFINKDSTMGMDVNTAVSKIRGTANTVVALTVNRNGKVKNFAIVRAKINVPSVTYSLKSGNVAYLRMMQFNEATVPDLDKYIKKMQQQKVTSIILDLRNNPGGYLESAVDVASEWVTDGTIVSEKDSEGKSNVHVTRGDHRLANYKTIVLVNGGSASASEIVAGALQDHGKATIMGEKTYGKGSVQDYRSFPDGSALKLTVAEWFTPNGKNINEAGITPSVTFKQNYDKEKPGQDTMLDKALQLIKKK